MYPIEWKNAEVFPETNVYALRCWVYRKLLGKWLVDVGWWHPPGRENGYWTDEVGADLTGEMSHWAEMEYPPPPEQP